MRRGVLVGAAAVALSLVFTTLSGAVARADEQTSWTWNSSDDSAYVDIERYGDVIDELDLFARVTCADGAATDTVGVTLRSGVRVSQAGDFSVSGTDPVNGIQYEAQGHFGQTTATGSFRLLAPDLFCRGHPGPGDTGVVAFDAHCEVSYCPSSGGGGGRGGSGGSRALRSPEGNWSVHYPPSFTCGRRQCASFFYDGPKKLLPVMKAMLPARLSLKPRCERFRCRSDVSAVLNAGKSYRSVAVPGVGGSMGTHAFIVRPASSLSCDGRKLKAKLVVGLSEVAGGSKPPELTVKLRMILENPNATHVCVRSFGSFYGFADLAWRWTTTARMP